MIKLKSNKRLLAVSNILDKIIQEYNDDRSVGQQMGKPNAAPAIEEKDVRKLIITGKDVEIALPDVYGFFIPKKNHTEDLNKTAQGLFPKSKFISVSGRFHYPPKGYMGWHTNSNQPGWRIYASRAEDSNKSFFRYFYNNKTHTEYEEKGWNFRAFQVTKADPYWHSVFSDTDRFSFGFRFE